jgi:transcriptional regulator with XRE-family HTH domain
MTNLNFITENIRILREIKGLSQDYMAMKLDITQSGYAKLESRKSNLTMQRLAEIANVLEVEPKDLLSNQTNFYHFENNQVANATQIVENLHMANKEAYDKLISKMEEEIKFLRTWVGKGPQQNTSP